MMCKRTNQSSKKKVNEFPFISLMHFHMLDVCSRVWCFWEANTENVLLFFFSGGGICSTTACKYDERERENDINIMCTTTTTSALFYDSFPYYLNGSIHPHTHKSSHSNRPLFLSLSLAGFFARLFCMWMEWISHLHEKELWRRVDTLFFRFVF